MRLLHDMRAEHAQRGDYVIAMRKFLTKGMIQWFLMFETMAIEFLLYSESVYRER